MEETSGSGEGMSCIDTRRPPPLFTDSALEEEDEGFGKDCEGLANDPSLLEGDTLVSSLEELRLKREKKAGMEIK